MMTKSTEFPRDTIWAKVISLLKIRFLGRDCIGSNKLGHPAYHRCLAPQRNAYNCISVDMHGAVQTSEYVIIMV